MQHIKHHLCLKDDLGISAMMKATTNSSCNMKIVWEVQNVEERNKQWQTSNWHCRICVVSWTQYHFSSKKHFLKEKNPSKWPSKKHGQVASILFDGPCCWAVNTIKLKLHTPTWQLRWQFGLLNDGQHSPPLSLCLYLRRILGEMKSSQLKANQISFSKGLFLHRPL